MTGFYKVFMLHLGALFRKRFFIYKKNIKGFIIEVLVPVILVLLGFALSKVEFFFDSDPRPLTPLAYPLP